MTKLALITLAWRNFLYANPNGYFNNPDEIITRGSQIQEEREAILDQMLKEEPDMNQIQMSKEEIAFQVENLENITGEFTKYLEGTILEGEDMDWQEIILKDIKSNGVESDFYAVAAEWKMYAQNADKTIQDLKEQFGYIFDTKTQEYLLQQMMDLQMEPEAREELQIVKAHLNRKGFPVAEAGIESVEGISEDEFHQMAEELALEAQADQGMVLGR